MNRMPTKGRSISIATSAKPSVQRKPPEALKIICHDRPEVGILGSGPQALGDSVVSKKRHRELAEVNLRGSGSSSAWCSAHNVSAAAGRMFEDPGLLRCTSARTLGVWNNNQVGQFTYPSVLNGPFFPSGAHPFLRSPQQSLPFRGNQTEYRQRGGVSDAHQQFEQRVWLHMQGHGLY